MGRVKKYIILILRSVFTKRTSITFRKEPGAFFWVLFITSQSFSADPIIQSIPFYSNSVQLHLKYTIILPDNYHSAGKRFPVMYLLHGHTGNYKSWLNYAQLPAELATSYQCIIILPDAGNSWYVNWTGQTDSKPHRWADMIVADLIPHVDQHFKTITSKDGRFIGGLSMGGFGALSIGLRNYSQFGFVFSIAGAINFCENIKREIKRDTVDWNQPSLWSDDKKVVDIVNFSDAKQRTPLGLVFKSTEDADDFNPYPLLQKTDSSQLPFIFIHCGTKDDFLPDAYQFVSFLSRKTDRYAFMVTTGEHEVPYWKNAIEAVFLEALHQKIIVVQ